jgi:hypothetical protein
MLGAMPSDPEGARKAYAELKLAITAALSGEGLPAAATTDAKALAKAEGGKPADKIIDIAPLDDTTAKPAENVEVKPADKATDANLPSFDVLRVEKDGSTVIAGHSTAGAKIDVLDGDKVIASSVAGEEGDFVVVLDDPLPAGDHQMVLQATGRDGKKVVSVEVATVSVPADKTGKLLAMVTKPGEASRIMEMPETENDTVVAQNADQSAKAVTEAKQGVEPKSDTTVEAKSDQTPEAKPVVTPALPEASTDLANSAPAVKQDTAQIEDNAAKAADVTNKNEVADAAKPADTAELAKGDVAATTEPAKSETAEVAKADAGAANVEKEMKPANTEAKPVEKAATAPEVLVNAVEIEGSKIFVAGTARPKSVVRVYADD